MLPPTEYSSRPNLLKRVVRGPTSTCSKSCIILMGFFCCIGNLYNTKFDTVFKCMILNKDEILLGD